MNEARAWAQELQVEVSKLKRQVDASNHDSLTGVLTRDRWESEAAVLLTNGRAQAVLWIDLDRFKDVNSTFGHLAGNTALAEIGKRLRTRNDGSLAGRFGGDEFVVVLPRRPSDVQLHELAELLGEPITVTTPLDQTPKTVSLTASIGVAVWSSATPPDLPQLLDLSDLAMHQAKKAGNGMAMIRES
nr:GGDEF domain-containing protein [Nocardioides sp. KC13]